MSRITWAGFFGLLALSVWWMTNLRIGAKPRSRVAIDSSAPHSARVTIVGAEIPGAGVDRFFVVGPAAGRADGDSDGTAAFSRSSPSCADSNGGATASAKASGSRVASATAVTPPIPARRSRVRRSTEGAAWLAWSAVAGDAGEVCSQASHIVSGSFRCDSARQPAATLPQLPCSKPDIRAVRGAAGRGGAAAPSGAAHGKGVDDGQAGGSCPGMTCAGAWPPGSRCSCPGCGTR